MPNDQSIAAAFKALSHPRRVALFRLLAEDPDLGRTTQTLLDASGLAETTFAHHLREMCRARLVRRRRQGHRVSLVLTPAGLSAAMVLTRQLVNQATRPRLTAA